MEILKKGSRGEAVKTLQSILNLIVDGIFGPITEEAVKEFQKSHGLLVDGIVGANTWTALNSERTIILHKSKRNIKEIIIHCSATPEDKDFTVAQIREWHLASNFSDIGYHYVIYRDGSVHPGRDIDIVGAHCTGHNAYSIGICYIGGYGKDGKTIKDTRTDAQKSALLDILKKLKALYPAATIHGHKEFANKACPCFEVKNEYKNL